MGQGVFVSLIGRSDPGHHDQQDVLASDSQVKRPTKRLSEIAREIEAEIGGSILDEAEVTRMKQEGWTRSSGWKLAG